ncbi:MAG: 4-(cytidine 5'-diphospho)-2-C-methyl-D-erythritol kinase [Ruminococcaceae bacterium]|nr:4-(cytidine 5'-diphospho)-2-C-methyl-D-erythritol kinase [Oscillospiraceae bacterium]
MIIKAFAKINLTLDITGILPGGYHALRSVMAPVSLCDEITLEKSDKTEFFCNVESISTPDNLCVRAANAFLQKANITGGVVIKLQKNIPFPAGLGGGSSDAAAVLRGMNELYGNPLTNGDLFALASSLGSDIPFCLLGKPALCEGRGEILTPLKDVPIFTVVIAIGDGRLPTPEVFKKYDSMNLPVRNDTDNFISALGNGIKEDIVASMGNAFTSVAEVLAPETKTLRDEMLSCGALASHLSGSGPSVYGIFKNQDQGIKAAEALKAKGYSAYVCETLN